MDQIPSISKEELMTVQEMIYTAFDGRHSNTVHFKLLQTILYILAQQLRILDRRVEVSKSRYSGLVIPTTSLQVEEVQVLTAVPSRKPSKIIYIEDIQSGSRKTDKSPATRLSISSMRSTTEPGRDVYAGKADDKTSTAASGTTSSGKSKPGAAGKGAAKEAAGGRGGPSEVTTSGVGADTSGATKKGAASKGGSSKETSPKRSAKYDARGTTVADSARLSETSKRHNIMGQDSLSSSSEKDILQDIHRVPVDLVGTGRTLSDTSQLTVDQKRSFTQASSGMVAAQGPGKNLGYKKEKLLVVGQTLPDGRRTSNASQLVVVTKEEFRELEGKILKLEEKFYPKGTDRDMDMDLMMELRRPSTMTDAIAGLHLASKLDKTEKILSKMAEVVSGLAKRIGITNPNDLKQIEALYDHLGMESPKRRTSPRSSKVLAANYSKRKMISDTAQGDEDQVTYKELQKVLTDFKTSIKENIEATIAQNRALTESAVKMSAQLEHKLRSFTHLGKRMQQVEGLVADYADKVTVLDTCLASQMTNHQENLTQMQHDLEAGIENMAEAMANIGGDTTAISELNNHFNVIQNDVDYLAANQKEFTETQNLLVCDIQDLWRQVEFLKSAKSDREEVEDALRDKAGIEMLNGLVTMDHFSAVRGDFEKRIYNAFNLFNSQEIVWQKMIDEVMRALHEKAEIDQINSLHESVNEHCAKLQKQLDFMLEVVGEPTAAALTKRIHRDAACISCSSPAHMALEEPSIPSLPPFRPQKMGTLQAKPKESGDHTLPCYPGRKIRHVIDQRAEYCRRYCGGSHTAVGAQVARALQCSIVNPLPVEANTAIGTDGKVYKIDEIVPRPCKPCNPTDKQMSVQTATEPTETARVPNESNGDMTPWDYRKEASINAQHALSDVTPPLMD